MPPIALSLHKSIEPGTYRYLGQRVAGIDPAAVPIAGKSCEAIVRQLNGQAFAIGRTRLHNAFVVESGVLRLLYVRPQYTGYRAAARKVFLAAPFACDYDHVLGKSLASRLGYAYVLVTRIVPSANRSHGHAEKQPGSLHAPPLCFFDRRIKAKAYGRNIGYAARLAPLAPFSAATSAHGGMTLKQLGEWAYAMGVEDFPFSRLGLVPLADAGL